MKVLDKNTKKAPIAWLPNARPITNKGLTPNGAARSLNLQLVTAQFCGGLRGPFDSFFLYTHTLFFLYSFPARIGENVSPQYPQICDDRSTEQRRPSAPMRAAHPLQPASLGSAPAPRIRISATLAHAPLCCVRVGLRVFDCLYLDDLFYPYGHKNHPVQANP